MSKIVGIGDIHIRLYKRHSEYRESFNLLYEKLKEIKPDKIVIAGDIAHSKNQMTPELVSLITEFFNELANIAPLLIIPGNHDFIASNTERLDVLTPIIQAMNNDKIKYIKESSVYYDQDLDINWVCWSQLTDNNKPNFIKEENKKYIGVFHGPVIGSKTDHFLFEDGYDVENFQECDFVIMADVHKFQELKTKNNIKCVYTSSLIQQDFGENINNHGFILVDSEKMDYKFYELENNNPLLHFKITDISDIENNKEKLLNG